MFVSSVPFSLCQISSVARSRSTLSELVVNFSPLCVPDTTTKQKIVVLSAVFYLDEFHKSRFVISFHIYTVSTRTEITFRMYIYTQAIPKGRVPVFYIPNSFWATKGHGRRRRSFWFSHEMSGPRFCGSGAHGIMERTDSACE